MHRTSPTTWFIYLLWTGSGYYSVVRINDYLNEVCFFERVIDNLMFGLEPDPVHSVNIIPPPPPERLKFKEIYQHWHPRQDVSVWKSDSKVTFKDFYLWFFWSQLQWPLEGNSSFYVPVRKEFDGWQPTGWAIVAYISEKSRNSK